MTSQAAADILTHDWSQVGVLFGSEPSGKTPDLERLLLETARNCPHQARFLPLTATWLVEYGHFVARHRLKQLALHELNDEGQAILGLIIDEAVEHGATRELLIATADLSPLRNPRPVSQVQRESAAFTALAERRASPLARNWGLWTQSITPKFDAIRPVTWLLERNPEYRDRIIRRGDLRVSVLETLRRDFPNGTAPSESALSRACGATRTAVRKALEALTLEGEVTVDPKGLAANNRDHPVRVRGAA
jgi:hypothetical protein